MFGVIFYIGVCMIAAGTITFLWTITRPIQNRDEMRSWRVFAAMFAIALALPYGYFEVLTRKYGQEMKPAIVRAMDDSDTDGELAYFRIYWLKGEQAKAIAVGNADLSWGGTERPTIKVSLLRRNGKWKAESYEVVASDKLNKDGVVFPPFF